MLGYAVLLALFAWQLPNAPQCFADAAGSGTAGPASAVSVLAIKALSFTPAHPVAGEAVKVQVVFAEPSAEMAPLYYRWKVNGEAVDGAESEELSYPSRRGDLLEVAVFADSDREESRARRNTVTVANAPPVVIKAEEHLSSTGDYVARLETSDPDGDSVALKLQQGPNGMSLNSENEIHWAVPEGTAGTFPVEIGASDANGAGLVFSYTLSISQRQSAGSGSDAAKTVSPKR
jgi:hypothetical protein